MAEQMTPKEKYLESFAEYAAANPKAEKALALAHDIRKFEIELYWKRATYFWAFTGAALAAHLAALTGHDVENKSEALLLTSCVGLVFAVAWYLVNRASKFWQTNWEAHVDLLETEVTGPIYKTVITDSNRWWEIHDSLQLSVSKINQLLSLFIVAIFLLLFVNTLKTYYMWTHDWQLFPTVCIGATATSIGTFGFLGKTKKRKNKSATVRHTNLQMYKADDS